MKIILNNKYWSFLDGVHACGYCYDCEGNLFQGKQLCQYFSSVTDSITFAHLLQNTNGLFAVVIDHPDMILAATDRLRKFPLFYSQDGSLITDTPWLFIQNDNWDEQSIAFYKASGAILPGHTLLQSIRQLPPASIGKYPHFSPQSIQIESYTSYLCCKEEERSISVEAMDEIMVSVFKRLVKSVNNRQIVVPLSAGNDSRLILCMLRRLGYENVVCYTVAGRDDTEWEGAHAAAQQLGYTHYRIDIHDKKVQENCFADKEEFEQYYNYVGCLTNFCWLYDYAALLYMRTNRLIEENAVFVPGHSGDMVGGSHLYKADVHEYESVTSLVSKMMYINFEFNGNKSVQEILTDYFTSTIQSGASAYSAYQNWIVQHRQCHNILNSTRVYEFFGYDVRLPWWDSSLYDLFSHLPYADLQGCRLYKSYLYFLFNKYQLPVSFHCQHVSWRKSAFRKWLKKICPAWLLKRKRDIFDPVGEWELGETLGLELSQWLGHPHACTNANELLSTWYLMRVSKMINKD